jgi:hypothetical protein
MTLLLIYFLDVVFRTLQNMGWDITETRKVDE